MALATFVLFREHFTQKKLTSVIYIVPSGNAMQVFAGHAGAVSCGEFTPDGKVNTPLPDV